MSEKIKLWLLVSRPFSFTMSLFAVILGIIVVWFETRQVNWLLAAMTLVFVLLVHLGANLVSEYFDYKKGIDSANVYTQNRILVQGLLPPKQVLFVGFASFILGSIFGLFIFFIVKNMLILYIGLIGVFIAFFYCSFPINLKYRGFGELSILLTFGIGIVVGTFIAQTGYFSWLSLLLSIPQGLLIVAVLQGNNYRDLEVDTNYGMKSLSILLGKKAALFEYAFLVFVPYVLLIVYLIFNLVDYWVFLTFLTMPLAIKNILALLTENKTTLPLIDVHTAQLHLLFTLLFILSLIPSYIF